MGWIKQKGKIIDKKCTKWGEKRTDEVIQYRSKLLISNIKSIISLLFFIAIFEK